MHLNDYLRAVVRRWPVLLASTVLFALAAVGLSATQNSWDATSHTLFLTTNVSTAQDAQASTVYINGMVPAIAAMATSPTILSKTIANLKLSETPSSLAPSVKANPGMGVIDIKVTADTKDKAVAISNSIAQELAAYANAAIGGSRFLRAVSVADATPPVNSGVQVTRNTVTGALLGLIVGCVIAALMHAFKAGVGSARELGRASDMRVIGQLPASSIGLVSLQADQESYRRLRAMVDGIGFGDNHVLAVSPASSELGGCITAANLAHAFSDDRRRVLLVDAAGSVPLASVLGVVTDGADPVDVPNTTIRLLDATHAAGNRVLSSGEVRDLIARGSAEADVTILRTNPLIGHADGLQIAALSGGVVLVAAPKDNRGEIVRLGDALEAANANLVGVVVPGTDMSRA